MKMRFSPCVVLFVLTPLAIRAQSTWSATPTDNFFNTAANWLPSGVPAPSTALTFSNTGNPFPNFNVSFSASGLGFNGAYPHYFMGGSNGSTLSIGAGGITVAATGVPAPGFVNFNSNLPIALAATQTWTTGGTLTVDGNVSGAGFGLTTDGTGASAYTGVISGTGTSLTKNGAGTLTLSGNNTYTGGTTVTAGTLYLGQFNNTDTPIGPSTSTLTLQSGATLAPLYSDITLSNAVSLASGATFGGSLNNGSNGSHSHIELDGTVTAATNAITMNIASGDNVSFVGTLTGPSSTAVTVHGGGFAFMAGTSTNIASMTADGSYIVFGSGSSLPGTSIQALNNGYVSVGVSTLATPPVVATVLGLITDKPNFNGTFGFDTANQNQSSDTPHVFIDSVDFSGFTNPNFKIGSISAAVLRGTITPPGQSYNFGVGVASGAEGGGALFVQSNLADHFGSTSVTVVSSPNSGGAVNGGMALVLQGNNSFTGSLTVSNSIAVLDSANALPSKNFSLGANSYVGYTENATDPTGVTGYINFADFASHVTSYDTTTGTSILGLDSHGPLADFLGNTTGSLPRLVTDTIDLSSKSAIFLGTVTGVTIDSSVTIKAPNDGALRLVNVGGDLGNFTINAALTVSNGVTSLVAGMPGSKGAINLTAANDYSGGTTLQGGALLVGNNSALGTAGVTVLANTNGNNLIAASTTSGVSIGNPIAVTDRVTIGAGTYDNNGNFTADTTHPLTLTGAISDVTTLAHIQITGPTTLSGANTYTGGTDIWGNTTVTTDSGLGTGNVDLGYGATLTFNSSTMHPAIGALSDAFGFNAGTGTIKLDSSVIDLTINQGNFFGTFSGQITGTSVASAAALIKNGGGQLTLLGNNAGTYTGGTTITAGSIAIGNGFNTGATFGGNVVLQGGSLFFRPGSGETMPYNGTMTSNGTGGVTLNGAGNATLNVTGGGSNFTGPTNVNNGTLHITADDLWSNASPTNVNGGATLVVDGNQTLTNLGGFGNVVISSATKTLTVNSVSGSTLSGTISGSGALAKAGAATTLTLTGTDTYGGGTTISAGALQLGSGPSGGPSGSITGNVSVDSGAQLVINRSGSTNFSNIITGAGSVANTAGTTTLSGANGYTGGTVITGSTMVVGSDANLGNATGNITFHVSGNITPTLRTSAALGTVNRPVSFAGPGNIDTNGFDTIWSGVFGGPGTFTKIGGGNLMLTGNSNPTFNGATVVNGGTLIVNGSLASSAMATVNSGAKLFGSGSVGAVTVNGGGAFGAGTKVGAGTLLTGGVLFNSGAVLGMLLSDATPGTAGTGWGLLSISGSLVFGSNPFVISVATINGGTFAAATNFVNGASAQFLIATASGGISGFSANNVSFDTTNFVNAFSGGSFAASVTGNNLFLNYSPIPEPSTFAALAGLGVLGLAVWRRCRSAGRGVERAGSV